MPDLTMQSPPKRLLQDLKVLSEIIPGDIIEMRGDLLQPFCSHAMYVSRLIRESPRTVIAASSVCSSISRTQQ
jgi:hypothetical protein